MQSRAGVHNEITIILSPVDLGIRSNAGPKFREEIAMPLSNRPSDAAFSYYRRLRKLTEYVNSHSEQKIPASKAAEVVGLNKSYFSTYFHRKTGIRFKYWLVQIRIEKAKILIKERNYTISEVAFAVGYDDIRTFGRAFKRHTGVTPSAYKKSVRPPLEPN